MHLERSETFFERSEILQECASFAQCDYEDDDACAVWCGEGHQEEPDG